MADIPPNVLLAQCQLDIINITVVSYVMAKQINGSSVQWPLDPQKGKSLVNSQSDKTYWAGRWVQFFRLHYCLDIHHPTKSCQHTLSEMTFTVILKGKLEVNFVTWCYVQTFTMTFATPCKYCQVTRRCETLWTVRQLNFLALSCGDFLSSSFLFYHYDA